MEYSVVRRSAWAGAWLAAMLSLPTASLRADFRGQIQLHPPAARAEALAEVMQEQLSLNPEQTAAVKATAEQYAEATDIALGRYQQQELRQQLKIISRARDAGFQKILNPEQFESYKAGKRSIMREMKSRMKGEAGPDPEPSE